MNSECTGCRLRSCRTTVACASELERPVYLCTPLVRYVEVFLFRPLLQVVDCPEDGAGDILSDSCASRLFAQKRK
jgi:hypothetical protein